MVAQGPFEDLQNPMISIDFPKGSPRLPRAAQGTPGHPRAPQGPPGPGRGRTAAAEMDCCYFGKEEVGRPSRRWTVATSDGVMAAVAEMDCCNSGGWGGLRLLLLLGKR